MSTVAKLKPPTEADERGGDVPAVYSAIAAVMADIAKEGISKDRRNQQQGYNFRGIDEVYNALSPILARHKLCILPRMIARDVTERQTQKGNALFYVTVEAEFDFVSADDGSRHTIRTFGEAMDSADKATNKAMSAAYKYAAMQTFCIPTEGDNDADSTTHQLGRQPSLEEKALNLLRGAAGDRGLLKEAWEKNKDGWKKMLPREAYARLIAEVTKLLEALPKDEPPPPPPPQVETGFVLDDEIPF